MAIPCKECRFDRIVNGKRLCETYDYEVRPCTWAWYLRVPEKLRIGYDDVFCKITGDR